MTATLALAALLFARQGDLLPDGATAPAIQARGADNRAWGQGFAGRITIVDFSATWCPHCRDALVDEDRLMEALGERAQLVIVDVKEEPALVRAFFARRRTPAGAAVVLDVSGATARAWRVHAFPTIYVVDKRGVIRDSWAGWSDDCSRDLSEQIVSLENEGTGGGARAAKRRHGPVAASAAGAQAREDARARSLGVEVLH